MCAFPTPDFDLSLRDLPKLKVLVVDDYTDAAETLADFISLSGHKVLTAFDGASALYAADRARPDLILMELTLPRLSGIEVCRNIKSTPWGRHTKVLAVTGWSAPNRLAQSREAGFDGHMLKPIDCLELETLLAHLTVANARRPYRERVETASAAGIGRFAAPLPLLQ